MWLIPFWVGFYIITNGILKGIFFVLTFLLTSIIKAGRFAYMSVLAFKGERIYVYGTEGELKNIGFSSCVMRSTYWTIVAVAVFLFCVAMTNSWKVFFPAARVDAFFGTHPAPHHHERKITIQDLLP